ncbi:MAG: Spy/CpxP family protein refolding chaperone [Desulfobacterales bacterium]|nr:MAG: Spy/CpxP family protein refolding chaperone [Desulfobacterales bacterium]
MNRITFFAGMALVIISAVMAPAGSDAKSGPGRHGWELDETLLASLNLTPEQKEKIQSLREAYEKDITPLRTQKFEKWAELQLLWRQPDPDVNRIKATQNAIFGLKRQLVDKMTDFRISLRRILTPEQLLQFIELEGDLNRYHPSQ